MSVYIYGFSGNDDILVLFLLLLCNIAFARKITDSLKHGPVHPNNHHCISMLPQYNKKSMEELRLEDYKRNNRGQAPTAGLVEELMRANAQLQGQLEQARAALAQQQLVQEDVYAALAMQREEAAAALAEHRREAARALAAAVEVARAEERLAVLAAVASTYVFM